MDVIREMSGIIAVVNTPFTHDGKLDETSLCRHVEFALNNEVVGFLISAMAAEVNILTFAERQLIAKSVTESSGTKIPVIGGTAALIQAERLNLCRMFLDNGCAGILVNIPYENENQNQDLVGEIADLNPEILMIQDWASTQMIEALDRGVNAFMPTILHNSYNQIFRIHRAGDRERAERLFNNLVPIPGFSHQHPDITIHFNKHLLVRQGIFFNSSVRQPILRFDEYHKRVATNLIDNEINLSQSLHEY